MEEHSTIYLRLSQQNQLKTVSCKSLLIQIMLMERYGARRARRNLYWNYYGSISHSLSHSLQKVAPFPPRGAERSANSEVMQPKSNKAKNLFITSLINPLTLLNSQPQRQAHQQGKMHSQEVRTTTAPAEDAKFLDKHRQN